MEIPQVDLTNQQAINICKQNQIDYDKVHYSVMKAFYNSGMDDALRDMAKFVWVGMESELVARERGNELNEHDKEIERERFIQGFIARYKMLKNVDYA